MMLLWVKEPFEDVIGEPRHAARFWGGEAVISCDVFKPVTNEYFKVWVNEALGVGTWLKENPQSPVSLKEFWSPDLMYQFVFPQIVSAHFYYYTSKELVWNLEGWMIGAG